MHIAPSLRSWCFSTSERGKVKLLAGFRLVVGSLFFTIGICRSGRHAHRDKFIRAACCNGYRITFVGAARDELLDQLIPQVELRPITRNDPRFPWEAEPLDEYRSSIRARAARARELGDLSHAFFYDGMPGRITTTQRPASLSLIDAHVAAGGIRP